MVVVEIFSAPECSLCVKAKETLLGLRKRFPFELLETLIGEGDPLYGEMKERFPVIHINGAYACHFRIREEEFIPMLRNAAGGRR